MHGGHEYVLVADLAREFGIDRSGTLKYLKKKGFALLRKRPAGRGQAMAALSAADAEQARKVRLADGFAVSTPTALG